MMWRYNAAAIVTVMGAQLPMGPAAFPCDGGGDDDDNCRSCPLDSSALVSQLSVMFQKLSINLESFLANSHLPTVETKNDLVNVF